MRYLFLLILPWTHLWAQKVFVLTYKYQVGDRIRVTTENYKNFSTKSKNYDHSTYGEMALDLYEEVVDEGSHGYEMEIDVELTRYVKDGQNLTYKLANLFKGDVYTFSFDRYGRVTSDNIGHEADSSSLKKNFDGKLSVFKNIFVPLPGYPVKVGDKWKLETYYDMKRMVEDFASEFNMQKPSIEGDFALESVDNGVAKIVLAVDISGKGSVGDSARKMDLDFIVKVTGDYNFDIADGKLINGSLLTEVAGIGKLGQNEIEYNGSQTTSYHFEKIKQRSSRGPGH